MWYNFLHMSAHCCMCQSVCCQTTASAPVLEDPVTSSAPYPWDCFLGSSARYNGDVFIVFSPFLFFIFCSPFHPWQIIGLLVMYFSDTIRRTPHCSCDEWRFPRCNVTTYVPMILGILGFSRTIIHFIHFVTLSMWNKGGCSYSICNYHV